MLTKDCFLFVGKVKLSLGKLFTQRSYGSLFLIGLLNGLLPCGLVYMAIAAAIATGSAPGGSLFMFLFGLGTLPMMLAISLIGNNYLGTEKKSNPTNSICHCFHWSAVCPSWIKLRHSIFKSTRKSHDSTYTTSR